MKKLLSILIALTILICPAVLAEIAATETATPEATVPEATPDTPAPAAELGSMENPIPAGTGFTFQTEITSEGSARLDAAVTDFGTVKMTMTVKNSLEPGYYTRAYSDTYKLSGTEAAAMLEISFDETSGASTLIPQDMILVRLAAADGTINGGYQMMDKEIAGEYDVALQVGGSGSFYKRYNYDENQPMEYVVLTYYTNGQEHEVYFQLKAPVVYESLKRGSRGDGVKAIQEALIAGSYLDDKADGVFGGNTEAAVKAYQEAKGLEQTGIADNELQHMLLD